MAASLTIGRRIVFNLIRWANDNFAGEFPVITVILVIMIAMALITQVIGVNTVLGAFVAGILIGESPILTRHIDEQLRGLIVALFMPVFFGLSGLSADLTVLKNPALALLAVGLIVIASVGKFLGAFVGGKLGGLTRAESLALGCGMNARGSTEVIVATIGLSMGVLNHNLFTIIVTMAIVTTMAMPPMLRWALKRLPMRKKERIRLEREELDAKGFVTNLERLLLAADDSANGKFASRLAGVIAGSGGKPTTIVDMSKEDRGRTSRCKTGWQTDVAKENGRSKQSRRQPKASIPSKSHPDEEKPGNVDVTARSDKPKGPPAIAEEARKGYDFMVVGIAKTRNANGGFSKDISLITNGFDGPLAVVDAREPRRDRLPRRYGKILIPGERHRGVAPRRRNRFDAWPGRATRKSPRCSSRVPTVAATPRARRASARRGATSSAILKDIGALGDRYDVDVRSTTLVEPGARGRDRPRSQARLRSRRARCQPAVRRDAVFRRHRRIGARTFGIRQIYLWRVETMRQYSYCGEQSCQ